jgi:predicted extracellular nuclease
MAAFLSAFYLNSQNTNDLIISEYLEGSSNNKYLEIYNGTGTPVNLDDYSIQLYSNGSSDVGREILLEGTVNNNDVFVVGHTSGEIFQDTDLNHGWLSFNGNDAVVLYNKSTGTNVDVFGCIGQDPGENWTAAGDLSTKDMTLRRHENVTDGATMGENQTGFATLANEWQAFPKDNISGLGQHPGVVTHSLTGPEQTEINVYLSNQGHKLIITNESAEIQKISIFNSTGVKISIIDKTPAVRIDVSALKPGLYILTLQLKNGKLIRKKFLKK